jgi:hypothetical protein
MNPVVMFQIGENGLIVHPNVTVGQEQGIGTMSTQIEVLIVPMISMRFSLAEEMKQIVHNQENLLILMDNSLL